jgi:hypothetical protein
MQVRSTDTYTLANKDSPFHEIDIGRCHPPAWFIRLAQNTSKQHLSVAVTAVELPLLGFHQALPHPCLLVQNLKHPHSRCVNLCCNLLPGSYLQSS